MLYHRKMDRRQQVPVFLPFRGWERHFQAVSGFRPEDGPQRPLLQQMQHHSYEIQHLCCERRSLPKQTVVWTS